MVDRSKLKAFGVTDDEFGGVVFARNEKHAVRVGAAEYFDGERDCVAQVWRAPWADWCAPSGIVPASLMVGEGWYFECSGCANTIQLDWLRESDLTADDVIGTQSGSVFCCAPCKIAHDNAQARRNEFGRELLDVIRATVRKQLGDVMFLNESGAYGERPYAYVRGDVDNMTVAIAKVCFTFPGVQHLPATASIEEPRTIGPNRIKITCSAGDRAAFEQFARDQAGARSGDAAASEVDANG